MSKRDTLMVHIKWFYRTNEIPEQMYQLLNQDRHMEHKVFHRNLRLAEKAAAIANGLGTKKLLSFVFPWCIFGQFCIVFPRKF